MHTLPNVGGQNTQTILVILKLEYYTHNDFGLHCKHNYNVIFHLISAISGKLRFDLTFM